MRASILEALYAVVDPRTLHKLVLIIFCERLPERLGDGEDPRAGALPRHHAVVRAAVNPDRTIAVHEAPLGSGVEFRLVDLAVRSVTTVEGYQWQDHITPFVHANVQKYVKSLRTNGLRF
jgi:hypothetical protein